MLDKTTRKLLQYLIAARKSGNLYSKKDIADRFSTPGFDVFAHLAELKAHGLVDSHTVKDSDNLQIDLTVRAHHFLRRYRWQFFIHSIAVPLMVAVVAGLIVAWVT